MTATAAWWAAFRPRTLVAAAAPVFVGTALAARTGDAHIVFALLCFAAALLLQVGTNLHNDVADFARGADTAERVGPTRAVQAGLLSPQSVGRAAFFCFFLAGLLSVPLAMRGGWPIAVGAVLAVLSGYAYTGGPRPFAYLGLGDLMVFLFFGLLAVCGTVALQTGAWSTLSLVAGAQLGLLATALLAVNNLRDRDTDARCGKRTLAVRFGVRFARAEIGFCLLAPFALGIVWASAGAWGAALLPLLVLWPAILLFRAVAATPPGASYNEFLGRSGKILLTFSLALSGGLLL